MKYFRKKYNRPTIVYQKSAKILDLPFEDVQTIQDLIEVFRTEMIQRKNLIIFERPNSNYHVINSTLRISISIFPFGIGMVKSLSSRPADQCTRYWRGN